MSGLFKKTKMKDEYGEVEIYEPTIYKKGAIEVKDSFRKKKRESLGGFDRTFVVRRNK